MIRLLLQIPIMTFTDPKNLQKNENDKEHMSLLFPAHLQDSQMQHGISILHTFDRHDGNTKFVQAGGLDDVAGMTFRRWW